MVTHLTRRDPFTAFPPFPAFDRLLSMLGDSRFGDTSLDEGTLLLDISEDDQNVIVRASLPGFAKDQIVAEVHEGILTIKAERSEESEEGDERYYRRERRVGSLSRRVALPSIVEDGEGSAEFKDGVLTLRLPKQAKASPRKIEIQ
ncbi:MAG TPA: Hsp20/alpha crystallin family protein [Phycisphaerales bacterium]|nr:Hsp20/alpha crystallin family protein [Phycisphaerales bacterium]